MADLDPAARRRYLDEQHIDHQTRAAVERLVEFDRGAATFLGTPLASVAAQIEQSVPVTAAVHAGPYKLIREIGRGGMGAVYEAERSDGELRLRVAVKFVSRAIRSDFVVERFKRERQILANLNHPHICRLIDAGTADDGSPYLVMELIEGQTVDVWAKGRSVREVCDLFRHVCEAVQHAHQNLVVHRDLKPGNILVTASGEAKLLDFGIAKLLDSAPANLQNTLRALTPDYASPEQVNGLPITAATDIYGLGCVLYHLLTGKPPRRLPGQDHAAPASSLNPQLRGDIDAILSRAMQPEPAARYATAREFSEELCRFMAHEPVNAVKGGWTYIAGRFALRHRWLAAGMAALTLLLTAGAGYAFRRAAIAERKLTQVSLALDETNRALTTGPDEIAGALERQIADQVGDLASAAQLLRAMGRAEEASKAVARLPADDAAALVLRSQLAADRGDFATAGSLARQGLPAPEAALQSAAIDRTLGRLPEGRKTLQPLIATLEGRQLAAASSLLAGILQDLGDFTQSRHLHEKALELEPGNPAYHSRLGQLLDATGEREKARHEYTWAYEHWRTVPPIASPETRLRRLAAFSRYAAAQELAGSAEKSQAAREQAAREARSLAVGFPGSRYALLGEALEQSAWGRLAEADAAYRRYLQRTPDDAEVLREFALNRIAWARQVSDLSGPCDPGLRLLNETLHPAVAGLARQLQQICSVR